MATITVRYFAVLREKKGREEEQIDVPDGTSVAEVYARLFPATPRLPVAYARNQAYADGEERVCDGDELAFLPPLGGG